MSFFTPAPAVPGPARPTTLEADTQAFLNWAAIFATESEAYGAFLAAANMFGAVVPYIFTTSTSGDPGDGKLGLNSATQNAATAVNADNLDSLGGNAATLLNFLATGTSTRKAVARIMKAGDSRVWIYASITAITSPSGYKTLSITIIDASSTNPFANGDAVILAAVPVGDKGDTGANGPWTGVLSAAPISGTPSTVTFSSIPTGYADLRFPYAVNLSTSAAVTVALSADGATFSSPQSITDNTSNAYTGEFLITDYLSDRPGLRGVTGSPGSSPSFAVSTLYNYGGAALVTGGVKAVRFGTSSGTFNGGSFFQPRAR